MKRQWWNDKVCYQIYPKSFKDSNGDGVGDLRGIIEKLDYLRELGIDIIWLSPVYKTPYIDQGYDISDYYDIDPKFGTMKDMEELIQKADERGMKILMDLVVNHCSDEHEWFQKACENPNGKYGKYFYIEKSKDGRPPTNLRSYFGGSAWEKLPGHEDYYYLHLFHKKQVDLNWENKEVREEIFRNVNWWLDKGLGGFRVDAIMSIKKHLPFVSYPADREDGLCAPNTMFKYTKGVGEFLTELKERCFQPKGAFTVGEVFDLKDDELFEFIGEEGYFSTMFDFSTAGIGKSPLGWYQARKPLPSEYIEAVFRAQKEVEGRAYLSNIIENHDQPRGASSYLTKENRSDKAKKLLAVMNLMMIGIPFIYQGQEIGMENTVFESMEEVDDISTKDEYKVAKAAGLTDEEALRAVSKYSRDNARTPMQWDDTVNAGFGEGRPWLKVNPNYTRINVKKQQNDEASVLSFYKRAIALRKSEEYKEVFAFGDMKRIRAGENVMAFTRKKDGVEVTVLANFNETTFDFPLENEKIKVLLNNEEEVVFIENKLRLNGYQALVFQQNP